MDRIVARRALIAAAVVGVVAQALVVYLAVGVNLVIVTSIVLAIGALLARMAGGHIDPADAWIPVAAVVVAAGTAIRSDETLVFLDTVTAALLLGASMAAFSGAALTRRSVLAIVAQGTLVLAWSLGGILRLTEIARRPGPGGPRRSQRAPGIAYAWALRRGSTIFSSRPSTCMHGSTCARLAIGSRFSLMAAMNSRSSSSMPSIDTSTLDTSILLSLPSLRSS
jgi:hypothetical protein